LVLSHLAQQRAVAAALPPLIDQCGETGHVLLRAFERSQPQNGKPGYSAFKGLCPRAIDGDGPRFHGERVPLVS
jgi:hypothetical protein